MMDHHGRVKQLLALFLEQHQDSSERLREFWRRQDDAQQKAVYELLHALKGSAGILQDSQLEHLLTAALLKHQCVDWQLLPAIAEHLDAHLLGLRKQSAVIPTVQVTELERLLQLIRQHNYAALEMARTWLTQSDAPLSHDELQRLLSCLESFDFQAAERYVNEQMTYTNNK